MSVALIQKLDTIKSSIYSDLRWTCSCYIHWNDVSVTLNVVIIVVLGVHFPHYANV